MESPNSSESMMIGRKAAIGPSLPRPSTSSPTPHWNTTTSTPKEAAAASRFITAAVSGTTRERNASSRSRKPRPMIVPTNSGSRSPVTAAKSFDTAVTPPTWASTPAAGMTSSRSVSISRSVSTSCGEVSGTTWMTVTPPTGGAAATWATPSVSSTARTRPAGASPSTTTWSGPLNPGPKPSASRS